MSYTSQGIRQVIVERTVIKADGTKVPLETLVWDRNPLKNVALKAKHAVLDWSKKWQLPSS